MAAWLNDELRGLAHEYLNEPRLRREGVFNPQVVKILLDEHARRVCNNAKMIWTILMFQVWRERWFDGA